MWRTEDNVRRFFEKEDVEDVCCFRIRVRGSAAEGFGPTKRALDAPGPASYYIDPISESTVAFICTNMKTKALST